MPTGKIIPLAALLLLTFTSLAQQADEVLSKFFAVQLDETVFMRWTISAGNTCEDTHIERSADGISYERIGLIGGICGSPDQSVTYEFTDSVPLINRVSYYRLELGYYGYSSPQIVEIIRYNEQGFLLAPNPFSDNARLAFKNETGNEHKLIITDMQGRVVGKIITTDEEFIIQSEDLAFGKYFFQVFQAGVLLFSGKFIVM